MKQPGNLDWAMPRRSLPPAQGWFVLGEFRRGATCARRSGSQRMLAAWLKSSVLGMGITFTAERRSVRIAAVHEVTQHAESGALVLPSRNTLGTLIAEIHGASKTRWPL